MINSNVFKQKKIDLSNLPIDKKEFKQLMKNDSSKSNFIIKQILNDYGFSSNSNNEMISFRIIGNHLYVLNLMPEISFEIPSIFMYDDVRKTKISNPTIYHKSKVFLDVKSSLIKEYVSKSKREIIEIPIQILAFEVKKGIIFGNYPTYLNQFTVDKVLNNKNIPDELSKLCYLSFLEKNEINSKATLEDCKSKVIKLWEKSNSFSDIKISQDKGYILNNQIKNLLDSLVDFKKEIKKAV